MLEGHGRMLVNHDLAIAAINEIVTRAERANEAARERFEEEDRRLLTAQILMNGACRRWPLLCKKRRESLTRSSIPSTGSSVRSTRPKCRNEREPAEKRNFRLAPFAGRHSAREITSRTFRAARRGLKINRRKTKIAAERRHERREITPRPDPPLST